MVSQLNIKSEEARKLALDLARLTGRSVTEVVVDALRKQLVEARRVSAADRDHAEARTRDFEALIKGARQLWHPAALTQDHGDVLYDAGGLPR
ncbi:type II toxin-antitoxin system VapB family antitoxin [Sphingomonas sp. TZW2008]|uniref:type II toxin-antitoxin system VapB family antitoxin n=1 Tax=Sphingomonas sp. TZW2008 TaxID=1917973 RepID=UPI0015C50F0E|nr:type II toxin-antitoxin system VapB family antitoxin [Sphingomonas sp. TZW2008]